MKSLAASALLLVGSFLVGCGATEPASPSSLNDIVGPVSPASRKLSTEWGTLVSTSLAAKLQVFGYDTTQKSCLQVVDITRRDASVSSQIEITPAQCLPSSPTHNPAITLKLIQSRDIGAIIGGDFFLVSPSNPHLLLGSASTNKAAASLGFTFDTGNGPTGNVIFVNELCTSQRFKRNCTVKLDRQGRISEVVTRR